MPSSFVFIGLGDGDASLYVIISDDPEAKLAAQLLSSRYGTGINVVFGHIGLGEGQAARQQLSHFTTSSIAPSVLAADRLAPVHWVLGGT